METNKEDRFLIEKVINKLKKGIHSNFLDPRELKLVIPALKKQNIKYNIYYPFEDSDKVIIYNNILPEVELLEVKSNKSLEHRQILGSLFSLGIESSVFGDVIVGLNNYVIALNTISYLIEYGITEIGSTKVSINRVDIDILKDYHREYDEILVKVPSLRIDAVMVKLLHKSRSQIIEIINDKETILNYDILKNSNKELKENDVFSVKKHGKYKYCNIVNIDKKNKYHIKVLKYK